MTTLNKPIERLGEIASLVERLLAIDEATMYERPATTRATIERAATALEALQREIAELREQVEVANFAARNGESLASAKALAIQDLGVYSLKGSAKAIEAAKECQKTLTRGY